MSTFQLCRIRTPHLTSMKLWSIVGVIVVVAGMAVISHQPGKMMPDAKASEAESTMVRMTANPKQKSWSDEWYEVHTAISDSVFEGIQAF